MSSKWWFCYGPDGFQNIKQHPFFANINWEHLYHKKLIPPFKPPCTRVDDAFNFDPEFTVKTPFALERGLGTFLAASPTSFMNLGITSTKLQLVKELFAMPGGIVTSLRSNAGTAIAENFGASKLTATENTTKAGLESATATDEIEHLCSLVGKNNTLPQPDQLK
ncbi:unnamed protein product [Protopolystoma xenopodis]|uniref:AGC-kinase C-terminal domain-containing protein n=1 Tax=Protopolystoma xenopodis TaxID=117903 RepID=A0A3S5CTF7_9PLAT|nr:unnamed protein product [Protopolystoma xenopodis]